MKSLLQRIEKLGSSPRAVPAVFLLVAAIVYGLFIWRMGFYWDDLPMSWIRYELGTEAMRVYFSTSRPVWGVIFQFTTRLLPQVPIYWQIFSILWRWVGVVFLWQIIRQLFPNRPHLAFFTTLFFLLYPGFDLQWVSYLTTHFYIVVCIFLLSQLLMLRALRNPQRYWVLTISAMTLSLLNIWMMEYFYTLELVRLFFIFYVLYQTQNGDRLLVTARRAVLHWFPYLSVFVLNVIYRALVFTNVAYQNVMLDNLRADPFKTLPSLILKVLSDLWLVSVQAWAQVFRFPNPQVDGPLTTLLYILVALSVGILIFLFVNFFLKQTDGNKSIAFWAMGIGFMAMALSGGPYWIANLQMSLTFPASRFTMSFMLGVSLLLAGLLELLPIKFRLTLAVILVALASGRQVLLSDIYQRDWQAQKNLFWQLYWRVPGIQPDTIVLMNEELSLYADNSIGATLNWIYDPKPGTDINYVLFYPTNRLGKSLASLEPNLSVQYSYIAGDFSGNTSDSLAFYFDPPACLRLLEPDLDSNNRFILDESLMREASALSNLDRITTQQTAVMPAIYGPEPSHGWCYYFEQADLARQMGDWEEVAKLGNKAFKLDDFPNSPLERFVFIEGYAHTGNWDRAVELSTVSYKVSKDYVGPLLCKLWNRIDLNTASSDEKTAALDQIQNLLACPKP